MLSRHGAMVATVGFLRGEPQDCNQSLCQKWAPWASLQLVQPNNKQQITPLACRQEQSPRGRGARKRGAYSSRLPTQGRHLGSRAGSSFFVWRTEDFDCCSEPSHQLMANTPWGANGECVGSVEKIILTVHCTSLKIFLSNDCKQIYALELKAVLKSTLISITTMAKAKLAARWYLLIECRSLNVFLCFILKFSFWMPIILLIVWKMFCC